MVFLPLAYGGYDLFVTKSKMYRCKVDAATDCNVYEFDQLCCIAEGVLVFVSKRSGGVVFCLSLGRQELLHSEIKGY